MADRRTRALAAVAAVVCGVGLLVVAAGRSGAGGDDVVTASTATTAAPATTTVPEATTVSTAPASPPGPAEPGTTATSEPAAVADQPVLAPPPTEPGAGPIEPPPLTAPAVGAYRERYTGPDGGGDGTLAVTRRGTTTTLRRRVEDSISSQSLRYDAAGIVLLVTNDGGGPCRFDEPPVQLPADIDVGREWHTDATCTTSDDIALRRVEDAVVTGRARTTVDGVALDTWIVQRHIVETSTGEGIEVVGETVSSELFAPAVGMAVYRIARAELPAADGTVASTAVAIELLSTTSG